LYHFHFFVDFWNNWELRKFPDRLKWKIGTRRRCSDGDYWRQSSKREIPYYKYVHRPYVQCIYGRYLHFIKILFLGKIFIFWPNSDFWPKFLFFDQILIFAQNFYFWPKFWFLAQIFIFEQILIFDQNFDFWPKFWFLAQIFIFDQILIFAQNFYFWPKFWFLAQIFIFDQILIFDQDFDFCIAIAFRSHFSRFWPLLCKAEHAFCYYTGDPSLGCPFIRSCFVRESSNLSDYKVQKVYTIHVFEL